MLRLSKHRETTMSAQLESQSLNYKRNMPLSSSTLTVMMSIHHLRHAVSIEAVAVKKTSIYIMMSHNTQQVLIYIPDAPIKTNQLDHFRKDKMLEKVPIPIELNQKERAQKVQENICIELK